MNYETILLDVEDGVGTITLNRPDKLNAMNRKLSAELHDAVKALNANDDVGCIVVTGAGTKAFSAGGDIHEQREDDLKYSFEQLEAKPLVVLRAGLDSTVVRAVEPRAEASSSEVVQAAHALGGVIAHPVLVHELLEPGEPGIHGVDPGLGILALVHVVVPFELERAHEAGQ